MLANNVKSQRCNSGVLRLSDLGRVTLEPVISVYSYLKVDIRITASIPVPEITLS